MELEIYTAFRKAGIEDADARAVVDSINKEIDRRYSLHSQQLATRGDVEAVRKEVGELKGEMKAEIAKAQAEIIKWAMGSIFAAVGLFLALTKML
ncbi:MAG: hypothetical protein QM569_07090 [Acidovorax sp.]|uniref:hypothetical protein n=1 Tax=Acidovorax sp. TaxID=1872122 RepID=UPI0039E26D41